jgi:hypothetical protein
MAAWKPVFALAKWWLLETVIPGKTWDFFQDENGDDFIEKFEIFHKNNTDWKYSPDDCKNQAEQFSDINFEKRLLELIK